MDNASVLTFLEILENIDYVHAIDSNSKRSKSIKKDLMKRVDEIRNSPLALPPIENVEESNNLQRQGLKIIIPTNIIVIYNRLEVLLGINLSVQIDILTEASNLMDEIFKRGEVQKIRQYRNDFDKFSTQ